MYLRAANFGEASELLRLHMDIIYRKRIANAKNNG